MSPKEAAAALGLSLATVYALCSGGKIRHYRLSGKKRPVIRIAPEHIAEYIAACEVAPREERRETPVIVRGPRVKDHVPLKFRKG